MIVSADIMVMMKKLSRSVPRLKTVGKNRDSGGNGRRILELGKPAQKQALLVRGEHVSGIANISVNGLLEFGTRGRF